MSNLERLRYFYYYCVCFTLPCMACNVFLTVANISYLTVIGVHKMHGQMHPNYCQMTILLVVDLCSLCSSLAYFMMTQPLSKAGKLPLKLWLLGNYQQV